MIAAARKTENKIILKGELYATERDKYFVELVGVPLDAKCCGSCKRFSPGEGVHEVGCRVGVALH